MQTFSKLVLCFCVLLALSCKAETKKEIANTESLIIEKHVDQDPIKIHYIQVALLLDTSNSMDGLIDQAKAQLWEIINELSYAKTQNQRPNLQIALYEYGNDNVSSHDGYVRKILPFTTDLDEVSKELFSLTTRGGSEYCGTVIKTSLDTLDWKKDADDLKIIFIAGNEPFDQGNVNYKDAASEAKKKNVLVNTIFCGNFEQGVQSKWQEGAKLTFGEYIAIDHNEQTTYIATPFDDKIIQLNVKLNDTYIPYGIQGIEKIALQEAQDKNAEGYSKANAVSRTVSKGSYLYKNKDWDLVDAEKEINFNYSELKKENLPKNLQDKTSSEIKDFVAIKSAERKFIQAEIAKINEKRREYLAQNSTNQNNGLENAMLQAIKKQAEKKKFSWDN